MAVVHTRDQLPAAGRAGAAGTATTIANGVAWQALMGSHELAFALSTLNTAVTTLNFEGVGGLSSATAVTGLNTALQLLGSGLGSGEAAHRCQRSVRL